ncbi:MAG: hypothetical protein ACLPVO_14460 [Desulfomonilaceae bacterium]
MKSTLMESRVRSLEEMMADLIATVEQTSLEMREDTARLKEDLRASNERMEKDTANFKEKTDATLDRMEEDTARLKGDLRASQDRMERDHRNLNKQLGEIANKQGRMTEDLVAPSICRILRAVLGCLPSHDCNQAERVRRSHPKVKGRRKEFDVIAECDGYILVNETKSTLKPFDIPELKETIREFREYFPEYKDRKIIGSLATLDVDESLVKYASREGVLILAVGDELMDVKNEPGFKPTIF